jgi:sulfur carrier protein
MQITLNGEPRSIEPGDASVPGLLRLLGVSPDARGVAIALDGTVLPRGEWQETTLADGQRVEVLTAAQGG